MIIPEKKEDKTRRFEHRNYQNLSSRLALNELNISFFVIVYGLRES